MKSEEAVAILASEGRAQVAVSVASTLEDLSCRNAHFFFFPVSARSLTVDFFDSGIIPVILKYCHFEILSLHDLLQAPHNSGRDNAAGIIIV